MSAEQESLFLPWPSSVATAGGPGGQLHARHLFSKEAGTASPVLLLHGAIESSRIFYSESGKGLGPYLTRQGMDVYAVDLFGRGLSEPGISRRSRHGQLESIRDEIPAYIELIRARCGRDTQQIWMAHSWGGVLLLSVLARFPEYRKLVRAIVFFGTKRSVHVRNLETCLKLDLFWKRGARALVKVFGYLPARELHLGADNESDLSHAESRGWVIPGPWVDPRDGFDYGAALRAADLPPLLFLAGRGDRCLGNPSDVRALIEELGPRTGITFQELSRAAGNAHDYGHVDMMTSPDAEGDHFASALGWLRQFSRAPTA